VRSVFAIAVVLLGCPSRATPPDTFVAGREGEPTWLATADGRLRVPLPSGLRWDAPTFTKDGGAKARADDGPTFVVVAPLDDVDPPASPRRCAESHREKLAIALAASGVEATVPRLIEETRRGEKVPRLQYAVPLEEKGAARPASTLSYWAYVVTGGRCLGISVTTVVHEAQGAPDQPDPEDLQRLERVFSSVAEGAKIP
jgi:hypothetical protein